MDRCQTIWVYFELLHWQLTALRSVKYEKTLLLSLLQLENNSEILRLRRNCIRWRSSMSSHRCLELRVSTIVSRYLISLFEHTIIHRFRRLFIGFVVQWLRCDNRLACRSVRICQLRCIQSHFTPPFKYLSIFQFRFYNMYKITTTILLFL